MNGLTARFKPGTEGLVHSVASLLVSSLFKNKELGGGHKNTSVHIHLGRHTQRTLYM